MGGERGAFVWYELMTTDAAAAKAFYDPVIGWTIADEAMALPTGGTYRMIGCADGGHAGGVLEMGADQLGHGGRPAWIGYIGVPDVDAAVTTLTGAGGAVHLPAMDMPGVGRMAMVADPWGAVFYLMTPTDPTAQSDVFSVSEAGHVRWNELWSADPAGAVALYRELFGWRQEGAMPMGELGEYRFFQHGETTLGAICPVMPGGSGSRWNYYLGVDDIDRAMAAVTAGGGTLLGDAQQIPGGEFSCHARDPQGADFGLVGPRRGA